VDDAALVQVVEAGGDVAEKEGGFLGTQAVGLGDEQVTQRRTANVLHDDERIAFEVTADVVDRDQVRALEVHHVGDAAQLDLGVVAQVFEGDLLPGVGQGVVDFAEPAAADGAPLMEPTVACVEAAATVGEISDALRGVWGEYDKTKGPA